MLTWFALTLQDEILYNAIKNKFSSNITNNKLTVCRSNYYIIGINELHNIETLFGYLLRLNSY